MQLHANFPGKFTSYLRAYIKAVTIKRFVWIDSLLLSLQVLYTCIHRDTWSIQFLRFGILLHLPTHVREKGEISACRELVTIFDCEEFCLGDESEVRTGKTSNGIVYGFESESKVIRI